MGWDQTLFGLEGGPRPDRETCGSEEGSERLRARDAGALEEVHACNTDRNLHTEENREGAIRVMKGAKDDKTEVYGSTEKDEPHEAWGRRRGSRGNLPRGHFTGMPSSPLHRRKEKGLTEPGTRLRPRGGGMDWHGAIRDWNGARKVGRSCVPNVIYHNRRNGRRYGLARPVEEAAALVWFGLWLCFLVQVQTDIEQIRTGVVQDK
ncbi:hypothetical protein ACSQ67_010371 [Phaseolus vulgaris]